MAERLIVSFSPFLYLMTTSLVAPRLCGTQVHPYRPRLQRKSGVASCSAGRVRSKWLQYNNSIPLLEFYVLHPSSLFPCFPYQCSLKNSVSQKLHTYLAVVQEYSLLSSGLTSSLPQWGLKISFSKKSSQSIFSLPIPMTNFGYLSYSKILKCCIIMI